MKKLIFKVIPIAITLNLLIGNVAIIGENIVRAVEESVSKVQIEDTNIELNVYTEKETFILGEEAYVYVDVLINNTGVLNDSKINISNANYIIDTNYTNPYINKIEYVYGNAVISLNQIRYGEQVTLKLPIKFAVKDEVNVEYMNLKSVINLSGIYKEDIEASKQKEVNQNIEKTISWKSDADTEVKSSFTKYVKLENAESNDKILIEQKIESSVVKNKVPKENESIVVTLPLGEKYEKIVVLVNDKIVETNVDNDKIYIVNDFSDKVMWNNTKNTYKIIYTYQKTEFVETEMLNNVRVSTKLLTIDDKILHNINENIEVKPKGNVMDAEISNMEVYKGYMYSNLEDTNFTENIKLNISSIEDKREIDIATKSYVVKGNKTEETDITEYIKVNEVKISKDELMNIFSNEGFINIVGLEQSGNIAHITKDTEATDGYITVQIPVNIKKIAIHTSKVEKEGSLNIILNNRIDKSFKVSNEASNIYKTIAVNKKEQEFNVAKLLEPKTEFELSINKDSMTTLEKNKNTEFKLDLISNSNKQLSYVNPRFEIVMPKEIKKIDLNSIELLYTEDFKVLTKEIKNNEDGTKSIVVQLEGKQSQISKNNVQIIVNADIEFNINRNSSSEKIIVKCKNQNINAEVYKNLEVISKYGMMMYTNIKDIEEYIDNQQTKEIEILAEDTEKVFSTSREILNNYSEDITKVKIEVSENISNVKVNGVNTKIKNGVLELKETTINKGNKIILTYDYTIPENIGFDKTLLDKIIVSFEHDTQKLENKYETKYISESNTGSVKDEEVKTEEIKSFGNVGVVASIGGKVLEENANITKGQSVKYTGKITNTTDKELIDVKVDVKVNNGHLFGAVKRQVEDIYTDDNQKPLSHKESYYEECKDISTLTINIGTIKIGETITFEYQVASEENAQKLNAELIITGKDLEEQKLITSEINCVEGEYLIRLMPTTSVENKIFDGRVFPVNLIVKNMSTENKDSVIVKFALPKGIELVELDDLNLQNVKVNDGTIEIYNLNAGEERVYKVLMKTNTDIMEETDYVSMLSLIETDNYTYYSNEMTKNVRFEQYKVEVDLKSDVPTTQKLVNGDKIKFTANLTNLGTTTNGVIKMYLPQVAKITKATYRLNGNGTTNNISIQNDNSVYMDNVTMKNKDNIQVNIEVEIDEEKAIEETFKANIIYVSNMGQIDSKVLTYTLKNIEEENNSSEGNDNNENNNNNDNQGNGSNEDIVVVPEEKTKYISGKVWIDNNKNGIYEKEDDILQDVKVNLITKTGQTLASTITDVQGKYLFENVKSGEYLISFEYDTNEYAPTIYNKSEVNNGINSDIIGTGFEGRTVGITDVIILNEKDITDIDAGLIKNPVFDMTLEKVIKKITVKDSNGVVVKEYNDESLTKIELSARSFEGSVVLIEYDIIVKNEGEIPGYVNEILDYMPKDTTFNSEINPNWYYTNDGILHNTSLAKDEIQMGQDRRVSLVLMKTLNENNIGTTVNIAEIGNATNDLGIIDKNSTSSNRNSKENDISTAENIVSIQTGKEMTLSVVAVIIVLSTIGTVIFIIKRKEG